MKGPAEGPGESVTADETAGTAPRFLFPIDGDHPHELLKIVCDLVADSDGDLVIASPVTVQERTPLDLAAPKTKAHRRTAEFVLEATQKCHDDLTIDQVVRAGRTREIVLADLVDRYSIATLVMEDTPRSRLQSALGVEEVNSTLLQTGCDTVVASHVERLGTIDSILVPVAGGPHSGLAIDVGVALARQNEASIELLHVYDPDDDGAHEHGENVLEKGRERVGDLVDVERTLHESNDVHRSIVEYTQSFDITIFGAPREGLLRQFIFGSIPNEAAVQVEGPILTVHRGGVEDSWLDRWV